MTNFEIAKAEPINMIDNGAAGNIDINPITSYTVDIDDKQNPLKNNKIVINII